MDSDTLKAVSLIQQIQTEKNNKITVESIKETIDYLKKSSLFSYLDNVDVLKVFEELIIRNKEFIDVAQSLENKKEHNEWLYSERKKNWRYWRRYKELLEENLGIKVTDSVDENTDKILSNLEDPEITDCAWDRRGLVVGQVQSGKTANYTGLICKAADAGYKIIIVLAGMTNSLRVQTQIRIEEGFLGRNTEAKGDDNKQIGVGLKDSSLKTNFGTTRCENGDFQSRKKDKNGIIPENNPTIFVVKKNSKILSNLKEWFELNLATNSSSNKNKITDYPLLMIDDEADNASVDTGGQPYDESGNPDPEYDPKTINKLIRQILSIFANKAYVGYTATPFANIFIHHKGNTKDAGEDLFPKDFILNLPIPSEYFGPERFFLRNEDKTHLQLVEIIDDAESWLKSKHRKDAKPKSCGKYVIPKSLQNAIYSFLLTTAVRALRGDDKKHSSMLIHVTRFIEVQNEVFNQVDIFLKHVCQRLVRYIDDEEIVDNLKSIWEDSDYGYVVNTQNYNLFFKKENNLGKEVDLYKVPSFSEVMDKVRSLISDVHVKLINGSAKDVLDYENYKKIGLKVIAIGGDKLARGLTLEGLSVSYFLRSSSMYDTLMQMGRWFGYRRNYEDLCRLFITKDINDAFTHITEALNSLRDEFDFAVDHGLTPEQFGMRVLKYDDLSITSPLKMKNSKEVSFSFSGRLVQTVVFFRDHNRLLSNIRTVDNLVKELGNNENNSVRSEIKNLVKDCFYWKNVSYEKICEFLINYQTTPKGYRVNSQILAEYIKNMANNGELTQWDVLLDCSSSTNPMDVKLEHLAGVTTVNHQLSNKNQNQDPRYISVGVITKSELESIDLSEEEWQAALNKTVERWNKEKKEETTERECPKAPKSSDIREIRGLGCKSLGIKAHPERGLLILSFLNPNFFNKKLDGVDYKIPIATFAISFPRTNKKESTVKYQENSVYWEELYD